MKNFFKTIITLSIAITVMITSVIDASAFTAWSKNSKGQFVNDKGKVIKGATMKGVDVSRWNGDINWSKVAKSDVDFAIIRCGYGNDTYSQDDTYFEKNVAGCEKYGIPYGVYIYSYATNETQALSEAAHALRLCSGHVLKFPLYYDMEDNTQAAVGKSRIGDLAQVFMSTVRDAGFTTGIYANLNWWTNYIPAALGKQAEWYKWVAQYSSTCDYKGTYQMWQCTSTGKVSGISGNVDINFWFGDYDEEKNTSSESYATIIPGKVKLKALKKGKKKVTVKWNKVKSAKGYRIQYSTSKKFKKYKGKTTTKKTITISKLKSKKKYYVRAKAFNIESNGSKVYSIDYSQVKSCKTK